MNFEMANSGKLNINDAGASKSVKSGLQFQGTHLFMKHLNKIVLKLHFHKKVQFTEFISPVIK